MMWLAYKMKPTGVTWEYPGIFNWSALPLKSGYGTPQNRLVHAVNWEASGHTKLKYFYVWVPASSLTKADFHAHVVSDITQSVPVLVAARTSNGTQHLPMWTASGSKINHQIVVVGYSDTAGTYSVLDTCGPGCNSSGLNPAVRTIDQDDLWTLIMAETDNDGIIW